MPRQAKEIQRDITPGILAKMLGCSEDIGQRLINKARDNYFRGAYAPELRTDGPDTKILTWDSATGTASLETW